MRCHHEKISVVWSWCRCGMPGLWTKVGTCAWATIQLNLAHGTAKTNMRWRTGANEKSVESVLTPEKTQSQWREGARKKTGFGPVSVELIVSCRIYNTGRWTLPSGRWPNWSSRQTSCPSSYNTRNVSRSFFVKYVSAPPTNQIINQSWILRVGPNNTGISRH